MIAINNPEKELLNELNDLKKENEYLKSIYEKDIAEYKKAEEVLRKSEGKYRQYVETAIEGILSLDGNRQITFVNQQMATMLGYTIEEMLGKKYESFMPEDQITDDNVQSKIRSQGKDAVYERCFLRKDGQRHWTLVSAKSITNPDGKFAGSFGMFTDINERKRAEAALYESELQYRLLFETAREGIVVIQKSKLSYFNPMMVERLPGKNKYIFRVIK